MKKSLKEAFALFDNGDTRSFNEIYAGQEDLFEGDDIDGIISPRMKKLFEEVYGATQGKKLQEDLAKHDGPSPSNDGVPHEINAKPLSKGPASSITQSGARQDDDSKLGQEPAKGHGAGPQKQVASGVVQFTEAEMKDVFEKAQLNESLDDFDDDDFDFDAVDDDSEDFDSDVGIGGVGAIEPTPGISLDDLVDEDDWFEDHDDGSSIPGSSDNIDLIEDDFDLFD